MPVIVTSDFPPEHGGIQRYADRLADALHARNHPVVVVAPDVPGAAAYDRVLPFPVRRYKRERRLQTMYGLTSALKSVLARMDDRIVIAMSWNPTGIVASCLALLSPKFRLTILAHGSEIARQDGIVRRTALRSVLAPHDVVANSAYTASLLVQRGIPRVRVVPCGIDPVVLGAPQRSPIPTVLSVGRLVRRKGYDRLIQALALVRDAVPEARLVIVGDGPDRAYLQSLACQADVASRVTFLGGVDDAQLARCYGEAWCFAMPNRREGYDVEGFGIVFLEAALHCLPAIGGRDSGAEDAISDGVTGLLVDGNDERDVARGLAALLTDPQRASRMGLAGRQRALREFRWADIAQRIVAPHA